MVQAWYTSYRVEPVGSCGWWCRAACAFSTRLRRCRQAPWRRGQPCVGGMLPSFYGERYGCDNRSMTPQQYVQQKAAASGSSFYYAFLFLPPPRRAAITAFYAFCREIDDVVDELVDPSVAATK